MSRNKPHGTQSWMAVTADGTVEHVELAIPDDQRGIEWVAALGFFANRIYATEEATESLLDISTAQYLGVDWIEALEQNGPDFELRRRRHPGSDKRERAAFLELVEFAPLGDCRSYGEVSNSYVIGTRAEQVYGTLLKKWGKYRRVETPTILLVYSTDFYLELSLPVLQLVRFWLQTRNDAPRFHSVFYRNTLPDYPSFYLLDDRRRGETAAFFAAQGIDPAALARQRMSMGGPKENMLLYGDNARSTRLG